MISACGEIDSYFFLEQVLIEPGTPQGSSLVREMRAHILQMEKKVLEGKLCT